jgi:hypothetical protein
MNIVIGVPLRYREKLPKHIKQLGYRVVIAHNTKDEAALGDDTNEHVTTKVVLCRERVRRKFLEEASADCLFFLDSDVKVPRSLISEFEKQLTEQGLDVISHVYAQRTNMNLYLKIGVGGRERTQRIPIGYYDSATGKYMNHGKIILGLGCTLIRRRVLEGFSFSFIPDKGDDTPFWEYVVANGFSAVILDKFNVKHEGIPNMPTGKEHRTGKGLGLCPY